MGTLPLMAMMGLMGTAPAQKPAALKWVDPDVVAVQTRVGTFLCREKTRPLIEKVMAGGDDAESKSAFAQHLDASYSADR
ncbi:MAG: hypothetical protein JST54_31175 [Deltaproteobacteria bacterium]|nr:hypothetical protein [Deltaproteobacteria bacterium]